MSLEKVARLGRKLQVYEIYGWADEANLRSKVAKWQRDYPEIEIIKTEIEKLSQNIHHQHRTVEAPPLVWRGLNMRGSLSGAKSPGEKDARTESSLWRPKSFLNCRGRTQEGAKQTTKYDRSTVISPTHFTSCGDLF